MTGINNIRLSSRVGLFTESVIRDMTRLAIGYDAINLAQGFPDFEAPQELKDAAVLAIQQDHNQYAITWGAKELRDEISRRVLEFNHIEADPEGEVTVTCGATEAMMASMLALIDQGDEAIIFEPFYENYGPDAAVSGATPRFVQLDPHDFSIDEDALTSAFNNKTKVIVVNTPNNPSGKVFTKREMKLIADLCQDHNAVAITDEIYEHIIYDGRKHISMASLDGMQDRTITIGGFSKTYSVTGWRIGYTIANRTLTNGIRKIHDFLTVGAPAPLQHAAITALRFPESYYSELAQTYDRKRHILFDALTKAGFDCVLPEGAYYILADTCELAGDMSDTEFAKYLVKEVGVASVPGSSFYSDKGAGCTKLRFTFSKRDSTLHEAARRLELLNE